MSVTPDRQDLGRIITFYSYKGGTGRSMALANVACLLAQGRLGESPLSPQPNRRVLTVDWDLEAPGLHRYFGPFLPGDRDGEHDTYEREQPGLIDLFMKLDEATRDPSLGGRGEDVQDMASLLDDLDIENKFIVDTSIEHLSFLKAGRFDAGYSARVSSFRWDLLYDRAPSLLPALVRYLSERFGYVLIDSRTGITDISGICTMLMPELLVLVFTPNVQSLNGVIDLIREATSYRRQSADIRPLVIFPLPSRIEPARPKLLKYWRNGSGEARFTGFQAEFESAFTDAYQLEHCDLTGYFDEVQIQHVPDYAYGEQIAVVVEDTDSRLSLKRSYESFTRRLIGLASPWTDPRTAEREAKILERCRIGASALDGNDTERAQLDLRLAYDIYQEGESLPIPELADGLRRLGSQFLTEGDLSEAETTLRQAAKVAEQTFGGSDLRVADNLEALGDALAAAGKASEAHEVISRALGLRVSALGQGHPSVVDLDDKLGDILVGMGRLEESRVCFAQGLEARRELFGDTHPVLAASLVRLGETAMATGSLHEAENYLNQALQTVARDDAITKARVLDGLGQLSLRKRAFGAAEQYFTDALSSLASADTEKPAIASILDGLAQVAIQGGDFDRAQSFYEQAQLAREEALGASHPATLRSIVNLGDLATTQGKWERAETQYRRVISLTRKTVGESHPLVAEVYFKLGVAAHVRGEYDSAVELYQHSMAISERLGDLDNLAPTYQQLGRVARAQGQYEIAMEWYHRSLDISERLGNQADIAASYHELGVLAQISGNYLEAVGQYQRALDIFELLGDQASAANVYQNVGNLAYNRGDYDEAARQYQRALDIFELLGDQANMATAYHNLGVLAQARGDYEEAARQYRRALDIRERLGDQAGMAATYSQFGDLEKDRGGSIIAAVTWHVKALVIRLRLSVPEAVSNLRRLAAYRGELGAAPFTGLLTQAAGDPDLAETITSLLNQLDKTDDSTA